MTDKRPSRHDPASHRQEAHARWGGTSYKNADEVGFGELRIYPDSGHGGIFHVHERFVPEALAFLEA